MQFKLKIWRQSSANETGKLVEYAIDHITEQMSFLEMMDVLNDELIKSGKVPVAFDHDCREGICGSCSMYINGRAHGPQKLSTTCQLYMRNFTDGETITIEPFRAKAFPIIKDLAVDRSAFDRIISKGGFISVSTGQAQDANSIPIEKQHSDMAMDAASCIGCGACVAACTNASAMLFVSAKVSHLALLPQGEAERKTRVVAMLNQMDDEGFGGCSNTYACEAECPKGISVSNIARLNREFISASLSSE